MKRHITIAIAAAFAALSAATAGANDVFPSSVNESGPVYAPHATAAQAPQASGASNAAAAGGEVRFGDRNIPFPSSVSESAPWLTR